MNLDEPIRRETQQFVFVVLLLNDIRLSTFMHLRRHQQFELARVAGLTPEDLN